MGDATLHCGIVVEWFEIMLLYHFLTYVTMVINGILFGVIIPLI